MMTYLNLYIFLFISIPSLIPADTTTTEHTIPDEGLTTQSEQLIHRYVIEDELKPAIFGSFKYDPVYMTFNETVATVKGEERIEQEDSKPALRNGTVAPFEFPEKVTILQKLNELLRNTPASWAGNNGLD